MRFKALFAALGAGVMYFFDPQQGRRRRAMVRDRVPAFFRQGGRRAERAARAISAEAYGVTQKVKHLREEEKDYDDVTLARKIETEIFRDADAPKGQVDINVVDGVVQLRGELESTELIAELEAKTRNVTGVKDVENLLHTPGTPAPSTPEGTGTAASSTPEGSTS